MHVSACPHADRVSCTPSPDQAARHTAKQGGLRYVNDDGPGIERARRGKHFSYTGPDGKIIRDPTLLARIKSLAIPPAWEDVWICPWPDGHVQATGRDARRRKQYRYHPHWRVMRDEVKYHRMIRFAQVLPQIRDNVERDLRMPSLSKQKVLATVVYLLQATLIRVGNDEYARHNRSFGITTLCNRHVSVRGADIQFRFRGKSGVQHTIRLHDPYMVRIVRKLLDLPGQELFQYIDDEGQPHAISSGDVNDYLYGITGEDYTAKDFRTWAGTVLAALTLARFHPFDTQAEAKKYIVQAIAYVAGRLGNTPSICRKCYVHPDVISAYLSGVIVGQFNERTGKNLQGELPALSAEERNVLALLQHCLLKEQTTQKKEKGKRKKAGGSTTS